MDDEASYAKAKAEAEGRLLAVFQERLRAHGRKMSRADALAFLRRQHKLLIVAAFSVPPGSDPSMTAIARRAVLDTAAANAPALMPRPVAPRSAGTWSPGQPHPRYADRKTLAAIIAHECFPISPRSLERWPLQVRHANGKAVYIVKDAIAVAEATLAAARVYKQGT